MEQGTVAAFEAAQKAKKEREQALRDHYAGLAMQALVSKGAYDHWDYLNIAECSWKLADEMVGHRPEDADA